MIKMLNESGKDAECKADFSNLPTLVLWMIKDRLDFPNNICFASVCMNWREATLSYSKDGSLREESPPPWLMIKDVKGSGRCEFINTSTGERYNIFHPNLCHTKTTETLFTKQGWLFLETRDPEWSWTDFTGPAYCLVLLNPFTNKTIQLPGRVFLSGGGSRQRGGAFTLVDGKPDLVVVAGVDCDRDEYGVRRGRASCIRLWIIRMADHRNSLWTTHLIKSPPWLSLGSVVIIGHNIYIVSVTSEFLVFNLSSYQWFTGRPFSSTVPNVLVTTQGVAWKADFDEPATGIMYMLSDNCTEWGKLKGEELYKCWFYCASNIYAVSKGIDDAVYSYLVESGYLEMRVVPCYHHDNAKTVSKVIMYFIKEDTKWVEWVDIPSN